jgi:hypothetical protein
MKALDELLEAEKDSFKVFHPVHQRDGDSWYPGNDAASFLIQCLHIWEDITILVGIDKKLKPDYHKKLILKYVLIELRSLIEVFDKLASRAMSAGVFDPNERQGWREITVEEHEKTKQLLKNYSLAKKRTVRMIIDIRDNIGAHRGNINWQDTMRFWDNLTPELLSPLLDSIPPAFDHIKELDLYEWNCSPTPGIITFIGPQLRPEYFERLK